MLLGCGFYRTLWYDYSWPLRVLVCILYYSSQTLLLGGIYRDDDDYIEHCGIIIVLMIFELCNKYLISKLNWDYVLKRISDGFGDFGLKFVFFLIFFQKKLWQLVLTMRWMSICSLECSFRMWTSLTLVQFGLFI